MKSLVMKMDEYERQLDDLQQLVNQKDPNAVKESVDRISDNRDADQQFGHVWLECYHSNVSFWSFRIEPKTVKWEEASHGFIIASSYEEAVARLKLLPDRM